VDKSSIDFMFRVPRTMAERRLKIEYLELLKLMLPKYKRWLKLNRNQAVISCPSGQAGISGPFLDTFLGTCSYMKL